jgi:hypothetical protein
MTPAAPHPILLPQAGEGEHVVSRSRMVDIATSETESAK